MPAARSSEVPQHGQRLKGLWLLAGVRGDGRGLAPEHLPSPSLEQPKSQESKAARHVPPCQTLLPGPPVVLNFVRDLLDLFRGHAASSDAVNFSLCKY